MVDLMGFGAASIAEQDATYPAIAARSANRKVSLRPSLAPQRKADRAAVERAASKREDDAWRASRVAWLAVRHALGGDVVVDEPLGVSS